MKTQRPYYITRVQFALLFFRKEKIKIQKTDFQIQGIAGLLEDHLEWEEFVKIKYWKGHRFTTLYLFLPLLIGHENVKLKFTKEAPIELTARTVTECACSVHRKVNWVWFPTSSDHVPLREVWCFTTYFLTLHNESFFIKGCSKYENWLV